MGKLNTLDPATIAAFENFLGLSQDGKWDPELEKKVAGYQTMLGQTPGQTDDMGQWEALTGALRQRGAALTPGADSTPMQDRTEQNTREINRRAAGFQMDKANAKETISNDYADRGFGGANTSREGDIGKATTEIDKDQFNFETQQRDALAQATRTAQGDIQSLYRQRADEELNARQRIGERDAKAKLTYQGG